MKAPSRRGLLGTVAALAPLAAAAAAVTPAAASSVHPDAELIARCRAYTDALAAYNLHGGCTVDERADPFWRQMHAARRAVRGLRATTLAGLAAKAEVAMVMSRDPDGAESFDPGLVGDWPEQIVRDLLRMTGAGT